MATSTLCLTLSMFFYQSELAGPSAISTMPDQPPLYQLFHLRPSTAQTNVDALVSALWCTLFPGHYFGQNHKLDQIFARMSHWPELATLQICPYYFDQVTYHLPNRDQVKHMWVPLLWFQLLISVSNYIQGFPNFHGTDPQTDVFVFHIICG